MTDSSSNRGGTLSLLAAAIREIEGRPVDRACTPPLFHGVVVEPRSLVEWIGGEDGAGVDSLALAFGLASSGPERVGVLLDESGTLYPPALASLGFDLDRLLIVRPRSHAEALWAAEQAMRSTAVGLTFWRVERLRSHQARRLKIAVEQGGGLGLLIRPRDAHRHACWADLRYAVRPLLTPVGERNRRWRVEVAYRRGELPGRGFEVEMCHETGCLRVVPELADATAPRRAS